MPSSHQSKKEVEDNVSEDGNHQLHGEIIETITGQRQSGKNSGSEIISKLAVGIKSFWAEDSKIITAPENCEYIKVLLLNDDILKNKKTHYCYKRNDK